MDDPARTLEVRPDEAGRRLDLFLADRLRLSRAQTRRLLARGVVRVDGSLAPAAAKGTPVAAGARIAVEPFTRPERQRALAQPELPLAVLADGPGWLAVDKPAGMPVHPLEEAETGTVLNALLARHPDPTDEQINRAMNGNLCRCGTYQRIRRAIRRAVAEGGTP